MEENLLAEHISLEDNTKNLVLFGGSPVRRDEVIKHLRNITGLNIYGTLSEEEGIEKVTSLKQVDIVLIGGRYSMEQRKRIKMFLQSKSPHTTTTEPGIDYPYSNDSIYNEVERLVNNYKYKK